MIVNKRQDVIITLGINKVQHPDEGDAQGYSHRFVSARWENLTQDDKGQAGETQCKAHVEQRQRTNGRYPSPLNMNNLVYVESRVG